MSWSGLASIDTEILDKELKNSPEEAATGADLMIAIGKDDIDGRKADGAARDGVRALLARGGETQPPPSLALCPAASLTPDLLVCWQSTRTTPTTPGSRR